MVCGLFNQKNKHFTTRLRNRDPSEEKRNKSNLPIMLSIPNTSSVRLEYSFFQSKRELLSAVLHSFDQKKSNSRHVWVTEDQTSDEEDGGFKRKLIFDSDIFSIL